MKVVQTEITPFVNNPLHLDFKERPYLSSLNDDRAFFHEHPELQLTFILEGYGKRIIGNKVSRFEPLDMVFIGSNVPHIWVSDPAFYEEGSALLSKAITVYIDPRAFQQLFDNVKEMEGIREMIRQASQGISIYGKTRDIIAEKLIDLSSKSGFERLEGLLQIMNLITISSDKKFIIKEGVKTPSGSSSDRLLNVISFLKENLHERITLELVADVACMTTQSFCRFFKNRTKKTFSEYLSELRIKEATRLLMELDRPIADIANLCGFISHSHFCKVFKERVGMSPYKYKRSIHGGVGLPGSA